MVQIRKSSAVEISEVVDSTPELPEKMAKTRAYLEATNPGVIQCLPDCDLQYPETIRHFDQDYVRANLPILPECTASSIETPLNDVGSIEASLNDEEPSVPLELSEIAYKAFIIPEDRAKFVISEFESECAHNKHLLSNLHELIKRNARRNVTVFKPTPIQRYMIPLLLHNENVMANSPTGSGKTLGFVLPAVLKAISRKEHNPERRFKGPDTLLLCGTKELNIQHADCAKMLARQTDATVACVAGGTGRLEFSDLKKDILCISPGRLKEALERLDKQGDPVLNLTELTLIVVDEADEFYNSDKFRPERKVLVESLENIRTQCQMNGDNYHHPTIALISATLEFDDRRMTVAKKELLGEGAAEGAQFTFVRIDSEVRVEQRVLKVNNVLQKLSILVQLLDRELFAQGMDRTSRPDQYESTCIIFVDRRTAAFFLTAYLTSKGFFARPLTGTMTMTDRDTGIVMLKERRIPFVVTTNLCARGIDISSVSHVINYELPGNDFEQYEHRVGRTGRAGEAGISTVLFDVNKDTDRKHGWKLLGCLITKRQIVPTFLWAMFGRELMDRGFSVTEPDTEPSPSPVSANHPDNDEDGRNTVIDARIINTAFVNQNSENNNNETVPICYSSDESEPDTSAECHAEYTMWSESQSDIHQLHGELDNARGALYSGTDATDATDGTDGTDAEDTETEF